MNRTPIFSALLMAWAMSNSCLVAAQNQAAAAAASQAQAQATHAATQAESRQRRASVDAARAERDAERATLDASRAQLHQQTRMLSTMAPLMGKAPTDAEALAMVALEGLLSVDPARALALIERTMSNQKSDIVKARALFVLSQIDHPDAPQRLSQYAKTLTGELQLQAIRNVGIGGDQTAIEQLSAAYASGSEAVKDAILHAFLIADRKDLVFQVAAAATTAEQIEGPVNILAAMGADAELRRLGTKGLGGAALVRALGISGDLEGLVRIANENKDPKLRVEAIKAIGLVANPDSDKGKAVRVALKQIYANTKLEAEKQAARTAMMIANDQETLLVLYRTSKDPAEKQALLRQLSLTGGDAVLEAIDAALQGQQP